MLAALAREMPAEVTWRRPEGGMFIWLTVDPSFDTAELLAQAVQVCFGVQF